MNTLIRKLLVAALGLSALVTSHMVNATVIDFNAQPEVYFVSPIHDSGYTFNSISDGLGTNNNGLWPSNGTVHLMSWTNNSSTSGFTLSADNNAAFSISSFLFASGYVGGYGPATSLVVSGTGGNGPFSQTFTSGVDYNNFGSGLTLLSMLGGHTATQYTFTAFGSHNRAQFDNIAINVTAVPEPESYALMLVGLGAVGAMIRRKKAKSA